MFFDTGKTKKIPDDNHGSMLCASSMVELGAMPPYHTLAAWLLDILKYLYLLLQSSTIFFKTYA